MPHCVIELAAELSAYKAPLLDCIFETLSLSGLFKPEDIKARVLSYDTYKVGLSDHRFIHVILSILEGRTSAQKVALSQAVHTRILAFFATHNGLSITVTVVDMDRDSYQKLSLL